MFKKMRRKEKLLSKEETIDILKKAEECVMATIGADGYPYAVPLNYVYHNGGIYFHCAKTGHKIENIEFNPNVSFCVLMDTEIIPEDFSTKFKSVVVFGKAKEMQNEEKEEGLLALINRYSSQHLEAGKKYIQEAAHQTRVFKIEVDHMTGKATT